MRTRSQYIQNLLVGATMLLALSSALPAIAGEVVVNGDFETGNFGPTWVHGAFRGGNNNPNLADHVVNLDMPFAGTYSALLGFKYVTQTTSAHGYMYQDVAIPTNVSRATLFFKLRMQGYDSAYYDPFVMQIRNTGGGVLETVITLSFTEWNYIFKDSGWLDDDDTLPVGRDVSGYAGQTIRLYFDQANQWDALYETWTFVDDVSLIYKKFVDLIVDGNGDDVFGAPGTGQGGLSANNGVAGDTLFYQLAVENEGLDADTYQLSATLPAGFTATIDDGTGPQSFPFVTPSMAPGEMRYYTVAVATPGSAVSGTYDVIVDAASTVNANRDDSSTLRAYLVDDIYGTDLVVDGNGVGVTGDNGAGGFALQTAQWDSSAAYNVEVFNTGNAASAFDMSFVVPSGAVVSIDYNSTNYTGPFTTAPVPAGGSAVMTLNVTVPAANLGGDCETIVSGVAVNDPQKFDTIRAVLRLLAPKVDVIIATSGDDVIDPTASGLGGTGSNAGEVSTVIPFPLIVQNEGAVADSFTVSWAPPAGGWTAVIESGGTDYPFPFTTQSIPAFGQASYTLKVTVPAGASFGTYTSIVDFVSIVDNRVSESVTSSVSVASPSEIDISIDGDGINVYGPIGTGLGGISTFTTNPGDSATFQIVIQNNTGVNSFEVSWNSPPGWTVTLNGQPSPASALPAGTYELKALVPASSIGGTFDIIVDGYKSNKPFIMDSVTGRVVVVPPALVDGIIDGDGDTVFGALGTGDGGASLQVTSAPAILNYTVELVNRGPAVDSYQVSWNTIPFWTATLDGSASPYTTVSIAPGASEILTFAVTVPPGATPNSYTYIIDAISVSDPNSFESIRGDINVAQPPRVDLLINGNGSGIFGLYGTGAGGRSDVGAAPGAFYTATLRVENAGSFPDSFQIDWTEPAGWPVGSVLINDGVVDQGSAFYSPVINGGAFLDFIVKVQVPAGVPEGSFRTIINAWSSLPPNLPESVMLATTTGSVITGTVFDDRDHDGLFSPGDLGLSGVTVTEQGTGSQGITGADGQYWIVVPGGANVTAIETNPAGFISLSPDTVGPFTPVAGDTVNVDFADVPPIDLSAGSALPGLAGNYLDFPHTIRAGTAGQVTLTATNSISAVTMLFFDESGNGIFDGNDRTLVPADLALDPTVNGGVVAVLLRVFIPLPTPQGTTFHVDLEADQVIGSVPPVSSSASVSDAVVVTGNALGRLTLQKQADRNSAAPGEVITYSITFFNAGVDSIQNVILLDPVSPHVSLEPDAFGPGQDLEWQPGAGGPVYLTFNAGDVDECEYSPSERLIRMIFSKNSPFFVPPGAGGTLSYRARVN